MKLDLDAINELNPPDLLNLRPMVFVVEVMMGLVAREAAGSWMMLKLVRALGRYQKHVRENAAYNLNVKIKAWVMAQAERRAWVRGILGEAAIRRWQWRRDNLYRLAPAKPGKPVKPLKPRTMPKLGFKPYTWKRFAMANLSWLEAKPFAVLDLSLPSPLGAWQQARESRGFKPVEFWAFELAPDYDDYEPPVIVNQKTEAKKVETPSDNPENIEPDKPPKQARGKAKKENGAQPPLLKPP